VEDQQPDPGDLTTPDAAAEPPAQRRRFWRRSKSIVAEPVSSEPEVAEAEAATEAEVAAEPAAVEESARRTPVGKSKRPPKPDAEVPPEEVAEEAAAAEPDPGAEPVADTDSEPDPDAEAGADGDSEPAPDSEAESDNESEPEPEPVLVPHRPAGRKLTIAAAAAAVLFVGAGAFAGAMVQPYLTDRATVDTKLDVARTAADAIQTLWTYTPDDMESLPNRSARFLAGDFALEYRRYIDAIVASNKQAQVTNNTQVMGAAVESLTPTEATAIVYTNSVSTSPVSKNIPSLRYLSYRLAMERHGAEWMITKMTAVTKLDLTPQL
jgi:Mce-associated membrane protein